MSTLSRQALWQRLQDGGQVEGDLPTMGKTESFWYVRVMLGAAGWIGSVFLLSFVGAAFSFVMQNAFASLLVGALLCGGAFALFKSKRDSDFITQFSLAIGLVGQMLLIYGLYKLFERDDPLFYAAVFVVEALLTVLMPNFIYRVMTSLAAAVALSFALNSAGVYGLATGVTAAGFAILWMQDIRWGRFSAICRPVGYGLTLSLLLYQSGILWGRGFWWPRSYKSTNWISIYAPWLGKALVLAVFLVVIFILLKRLHVVTVSRSGMAVLAAVTLVMAASFPAPGMVQALLILIVGFAVCNRVLIGLGLLALAGFLSNYYYMMQSTLLVKSMLLLGLGAILLVGRLLMRKWLPTTDTGGSVDA